MERRANGSAGAAPSPGTEAAGTRTGAGRRKPMAWAAWAARTGRAVSPSGRDQISWPIASSAVRVRSSGASASVRVRNSATTAATAARSASGAGRPGSGCQPVRGGRTPAQGGPVTASGTPKGAPGSGSAWTSSSSSPAETVRSSSAGASSSRTVRTASTSKEAGLAEDRQPLPGELEADGGGLVVMDQAAQEGGQIGRLPAVRRAQRCRTHAVRAPGTPASSGPGSSGRYFSRKCLSSSVMRRGRCVSKS